MEAKGILSNIADGFRRDKTMRNSLITQITMHEDAKMSQTHMYTANLDFKGAFGGMYRRILFKTVRD